MSFDDSSGPLELSGDDGLWISYTPSEDTTFTEENGNLIVSDTDFFKFTVNITSTKLYEEE